MLVELWSQEFLSSPFLQYLSTHLDHGTEFLLLCPAWLMEWSTSGDAVPMQPLPNPAVQDKTALPSLCAPPSHHRLHLCLAKCSQILPSWRCYLNVNYYLQYLMLDISFREVSSLHLFAAAYPFRAIIYMQRFSLSYHTFSNMFWWSLNSSNWAPALCILFISYLVCIKFCHRLGLAFIFL